VRVRDLALLGVAAVAGLALTACGPSNTAAAPSKAAVPAAVSAAQLKTVTLRVGDQKGSSSQVLLQAAGLLKDVPYKIQWSTFTSGPPMLEAANDNAIDIGQVGNTPPIFSAAAGGNIDIVSALRGVGDSVLVPKNSTITTLAQLRGKKIAVAQGSSGNGTLLNTLNAAGLKPSDVHISYLQPSDAYAAFTQGSVDAWAIWQPYASEAVQNLGAKTLLTGDNSLNGTGPANGKHLSNGLSFQVANRAALSDAGKNAAIQDYVTRIAKADEWAKAHPDQWAAIYAQESQIPVATAKAALPGVVLTPITIDSSVINSEQQLADAFTAAGQIPSKVTVSNFVDNRYNNAIAPLARSN
jgi:sulfonate transport system substrate-binding protein